VRALIAGVPNVGKSTLLNTLMNRNVAKVGDKPAVTKDQQLVTLANGMQITDSPGLMWPKIEEESRAFRLALAGSIPDTAIDYLTIGLFGGRFFLEKYPELVLARYKLEVKPRDAEALLIEIGRRRGALRKGGIVDLHKAADVLVHEFRDGVLGPISLEFPPPAEPRGVRTGKSIESRSADDKRRRAAGSREVAPVEADVGMPSEPEPMRRPSDSDRQRRAREWRG